MSSDMNTESGLNLTPSHQISYIIAGWLYDLTEYYPASFFLGASAMLIASLVMIPVRNYRFTQTETEADHKQMDTNEYISNTAYSDGQNPEGCVNNISFSKQIEQNRAYIPDSDYITHI